MRKLYFALAVLLFFFNGISSASTAAVEKGVSKELALYRKNTVSDVVYTLKFKIPGQKDSSVLGKESINFSLSEKCKIILDFKESAQFIKSVALNGMSVKYNFENEHIVLDAKHSRKGVNTVYIEFIGGNSSLNRQEEYLYTLLVPDRARTLFPCFDQPDLKSKYNLTLEIPSEWQGVANGKIKSEKLSSQSVKVIEFNETEPIPTYLFSFVAGKLSKITQTKNGMTLSLYHRENDPQKLSQCNDILDEVFHSLEWLEEYTGIKYPFAKYDLIILPGFQYGGMEHTGATLYADRTMFLEKNPTTAERLSRSSLIAHETSHMWFGDYVTMKWFDDVWTKEVFANYFAAAIVAPMYKEINHKFNFINSYYPSAYSEDRTSGTNSIQQNLDNLNKAGLVYGNIIYNKAPVVMEMLVKRAGEQSFREGIREYLKTYAYSNADWDDLIKILDSRTDQNLCSWSDVWIKEKGMPQISARIEGNIMEVSQKDKFGRDLVWKQPLVYMTGKKGVYDIDNCRKIRFDMDSSICRLPVPENSAIIIPNTEGFGYGYFKLDPASASWLLSFLANYANNQSMSDSLKVNDIFNESVLITLYENLLDNNLDSKAFIDSLMIYILNESNNLIFTRVLNYVSNAFILFRSQSGADTCLEKSLWSIVKDEGNSGQKRLLAFRTYIDVATSDDAVQRLYEIWKDPGSFVYLSLGERDLIKLSYELAVRIPEKYKEITSLQLSRISNTDRIREYKFIAPSLSPDKAVRDSVFNSLLTESNREVEPWAASALSYLNHYKRDKESVCYILPGLEIIQEIQQTGDIFFPRNWLAALLGGHRSAEAAKVVSDFLGKHKELDPKLISKIQQQSYHLEKLPK